MIKTSLN